jgi:ABC-type polysaccharide/polyol phosphate export permease
MAQIQKIRLAVLDLRAGLLAAGIWSMLGWQEIKHRYRRSMLGPFWLTISTGALIGGMGPLYGRLFGQDIAAYFPYLAIGFVLWQLMSSVLIDSGQVFIGAEQFIKQVKIPLTVYVLRMVWRNLIIFGHNLAIVAAVLFFFPPAFHWHVLLAPLGIVAIAANAIWIGLFLGMLSARFRDVPLLVTSLIQIFFFLTPVMWKADMLGTKQWAVYWNPFFHFLEVVRAPLLGLPANPLSWPVVIGVTVCGFAFTLAVFGRYRPRIAYWV